MKLFQRLLAGITLVAFAAIISANVLLAQTQISAAYNCSITNQFFNPLVVAPPPAGGIISDNGFRSFSNANDPDDGVVVDVPTGFSFDYNGTTYSTVNICVNGWMSLGTAEGHPIPTITNDKYFLFLPNRPNATLAPFWGDHYYRSGADLGLGFKQSRVQFSTFIVPDPNQNALPGAVIHTFIVEWKDLNINITQPPSSSDPNSIATFQVKIIENAMANDQSVPDKRVTIEFHYGPIGNSGNVKTQGCTVGIEDKDGLSFMNALFTSAFQNGVPIKTNTDSLTTCWPPASCLPGRVITFTPVGVGTLAQWGDGDANLTQIDPTVPANIRGTQNLFVTLADADLILSSVAQEFPPMDPAEGRGAFHGDANHNGRSPDPANPAFYLYKVTSYDAAYIMMYLAAKLPVLPWPVPLPTPSWKETASDATSISGITADAQSVKINGNTAIVPLVLHGTVNGPLGVELNVASLNTAAMQFVGVESSPKVMIHGNAGSGKVALAASGIFNDGDVLGYIEFNIASRVPADFELTNVMINDESFSSSRSTLAVSGVGASNANGFNVGQNMPNPFVLTNAAQTSIRFNLAEAQSVSVRIFDVLGKEVRSLVSGQTFAAGASQINWDGRDNSGTLVPAGSYYYQLTAGENMQTVKMQVAN
ncbi:MAG: FlgD immunoglobulin-like domain containing protein [Candidatus Kapaibacterium sp.]